MYYDYGLKYTQIHCIHHSSNSTTHFTDIYTLTCLSAKTSTQFFIEPSKQWSNVTPVSIEYVQIIPVIWWEINNWIMIKIYVAGPF